MTLSPVGFFFSFSPAQNYIAGDGLGIQDELISLEVSCPEVPDLTLIDLPGITRVPVGNQPADIGRQVRFRLFRPGLGVQVVLPEGGCESRAALCGGIGKTL